MSNRKAYSMVEILVVLGIVGAVLGVLFMMRSGATSASLDSERLEEYFNLKARLEARMREDLRNCREIVKKEEGYFQLKVFEYLPESARLSEYVVEYQLVGREKRKVERRRAGKAVQVYDFTKMARERKVRLEISTVNN